MSSCIVHQNILIIANFRISIVIYLALCKIYDIFVYQARTYNEIYDISNTLCDICGLSISCI